MAKLKEFAEYQEKKGKLTAAGKTKKEDPPPKAGDKPKGKGKSGKEGEGLGGCGSGSASMKTNYEPQLDESCHPFEEVFPTEDAEAALYVRVAGSDVKYA